MESNEIATNFLVGDTDDIGTAKGDYDTAYQVLRIGLGSEVTLRIGESWTQQITDVSRIRYSEENFTCILLHQPRLQ